MYSDLWLNLRKRLTLVLVALSVITITILAFVFHQQIKNQLNAWKLLPEPEKLTELYFTYPNNLPTTYTPNQTQTVSFTFHNLEYKTVNYTYQVTEENQDGSQSVTLASGSAKLSQNQYVSPVVSVVPQDLGSRVKVVVNLPTVNESIDYWVEVKS